MAPNQEPITPDGPWQHLVDVVNEWPGTAIVSMEFLAPRKEPKIEVIKEAFAGTDLQVVLTARDLARSLPAMWTESTQNRGVRTWEEFLDAVRNEGMAQKPGRWFWKHQRVADIASRWSDAVGRDHFTLITVPPSGSPPDVLWDRFAEVAGIPEGLCDPRSGATPGSTRRRRSCCVRSTSGWPRTSSARRTTSGWSRVRSPSRAWPSVRATTASAWGSTSAGSAAGPGRSSTTCGSWTSASSVTSTSSRRGRCPACTPRR